jgi:LmbE family N-acetylglucosaminyl deacetylase/glycosyltransferase involved in cell wall biosynthesis
METEEKLIPYHSTDLTGKRVLVLAPHPDDETFGCGGSLVLHARAGDPVKVVFLTNGAKGDSSGKNKEEYVAIRQREAVSACACLGVTDLEFWSYEDRSLAGSRGVLLRLIDLLESFRPELVYAPSPMEFHPDHRAACFLLCDAISGFDSDLEVAFYELGQPLSPNLLIDITQVLPQKTGAMDLYESQLKERPYKDITVALNRYRSMTLPQGATHAEGFSVWEAGVIRGVCPLSIPFHQVRRLAPDPGESGPLVSVIVRTRNRPALLANALRSIAGQTYANLEIVVVNDGGQDVKAMVTALAGGIPVTYIRHKVHKGRAAAANSGLKAARGAYLNFLDDDDVFLPGHVETLVSHLVATNEKVAYSNVMNVYFTGPPERSYAREREELVFNLDFDPDRLLFENYIPLMSVLFSRDVLLKVEGFCEDLILFEDWDFWIRVSRHFQFQHIDKTTAEYRFYGVKGIEASHRQKYRYEEAKAKVFDRTLQYLNGGAWVSFLEGGWIAGLRREVWDREKKLSGLERQVDDLSAREGSSENRSEQPGTPMETAGKNLVDTAFEKMKRLIRRLGAEKRPER